MQVVQLLERLFATLFATCLGNLTVAQISVALVIESAVASLEFMWVPFTDKDEEAYNLMWRYIAVGILFTALLIETIGKPFALVGDIFLTILTLAAFLIFIQASLHFHIVQSCHSIVVADVFN